MDRRRRSACILPFLAAVMTVATIAYAQRERFDLGAVTIAFDRPPAWHLVDAPDSPPPFTITVADDARAAIAINVIALDADTEREIRELGSEATAREAWDGFADEIPAARVTGVGTVRLANGSAERLDFADPDLTGSVVVFVADGVLVTIVATAPLARRDTLAASLDTVLAQLEVRGPRAEAQESPLLRHQATTTALGALFIEPFTSRDAGSGFGFWYTGAVHETFQEVASLRTPYSTT